MAGPRGLQLPDRSPEQRHRQLRHNLAVFQDATGFVDVNLSYDVRENVVVYSSGSNVTGEIEKYYVRFADGRDPVLQPEPVRAALHHRHSRQVVIWPDPSLRAARDPLVHGGFASSTQGGLLA